jgi:hypothetical protein
MAKKLRNRSIAQNIIEINIEDIEDSDENESNEELETTFTSIQKLEVFFEIIFN